MLVTISRNLKFGTVEILKGRKGPALIAAMRNVIKLYKTAGFVIQTALMDGEFQHIHGELAEAGVTLYEMGRDEHVGDVLYIQTIKENVGQLQHATI